ncbi:hypothetical protein [Bacillus cereus]|nr:hypothetical protein [Bacillus cereus]
MIERIWNVMEENVLANCYHETMDQLIKILMQFSVVFNVQTCRFF